MAPKTKKLGNLSKKGVAKEKAGTVKGGSSNVSKTRSEISMTFARNARA